MKTHLPWGETRDENRLSVTFCDLDKSRRHTFAHVFKSHHNVRVLEGDITKLKSQCLVTAGNSFGDMGGGVDRAIDLMTEGEAQCKVQAAIRDRYLGELPVGVGTTVELSSFLLLLAPTMRVPGVLKDSLNAYLAFRGALVEIYRFNQTNETSIREITVPSFCCGVGGMSAIDSATQMEGAYRNIAEGEWTSIVHPAMSPFASM